MRYAEARDTTQWEPQAESRPRPQDDEPDPLLLAHAPAILRFSSGTAGRPILKLFAELFNDQSYKGAERILHERQDAFSPFEKLMCTWVLYGIRGHEMAELWANRASSQAKTPREQASVFENKAFLCIRQGRLGEAKKMCELGLRICPTVEGLWINLLVALDRMGLDSIVDVVLERIPRLRTPRGGTLELYLMNNPEFEAIVCNGG
jgi:hypothetical protein